MKLLNAHFERPFKRTRGETPRGLDPLMKKELQQNQRQATTLAFRMSFYLF